ncbi:unnamed protein product [Blepharisma stoltei]|uniref:LRAT domain-containing protein n=1 Tax=Blepharisma stoltei TaxID=1481888 RepID=A0AAU9KDM0_9CILI|nr:unnamed protein product [Blepharisma stoltei]
MGGTLEGTKRQDAHILAFAESNGEGIVLVEQYWKYKKDITGALFGVKHGYLVTTTQSGARSKWDIIWHPARGNLIRKIKYSPVIDDEYHAWQRTKVEPNLTEKDLEKLIRESNLNYDVMNYNCWHHSNSLYSHITGEITSDHPHAWVLNSWKSLLGWFYNHEEATRVNKRISEAILRAMFGGI